MGALQLRPYHVTTLLWDGQSGQERYEQHTVVASTPTEAQALVVVLQMRRPNCSVISAFCSLADAIEAGKEMIERTNVISSTIAELTRISQTTGPDMTRLIERLRLVR